MDDYALVLNAGSSSLSSASSTAAGRTLAAGHAARLRHRDIASTSVKDVDGKRLADEKLTPLSAMEAPRSTRWLRGFAAGPSKFWASVIA